jgi:hypothetical protein
VAGNTAGTSPDIETYSPSNLISSNGANFVGSPTGAAGLKSTDKTFASTGKTFSQLLAPLANNGGITFTHALVNGSPAINGGNNTDIPADTTDEGLRGVIQSGVITVNSINDIPTIVAPGLVDQSMKIGDILSLPLSGIFADVDLDTLTYTVSNNYLSTKASAIINGTNINLKALANGVTNITIQANDGNMGTVTDTFEIAVGTRDPTPVQVATTAALIAQNGLFELTVNVTNTTPRAINGFRVHVDYSSYLAAHPSLRLYNASSPAENTDVYVDHLYPVAVDSTVPVRLLCHTSNRRFPIPFTLGLSVEILANSAVSDHNSDGVQPRIISMTGGDLMLEFPSTPGEWYRVRYSPDMTNWFDCPVIIKAVADRTQCIDSGAPFTPVPPSQAPSRFYRVNEISVP